MRKIILSAAAAGAALIAASPAAAQYYPGPQPYGYNGYGYNNWGQFRALQARIDNVERQINWLDRNDRIGDRSADRLRFEAQRLEQRLRYAARGGLNPYEARDIQYGISRLEQHVHYAVASAYGGNRWRDRDNRWDRDDRWNHDRDED